MGFEIWSKMFTAGSISIAAPPKLIMDALGGSTEVFSYDVASFVVEYTLITLIVSILSIIVMFLTKPDPTSSLQEFYKRVRPAGPGWKPIAKLCPEVKITDSLIADLAAWFVGLIFVYSAVFASGGILLGKWQLSIPLGVVCLITAVLLWKMVIPRYEKIVKLDRKIEEERKNDES
jgi:hypothetical protein